MDVRLVTDDGVRDYPVDDLKGLLSRDDGLVWVDLVADDENAELVLSEIFGFHPLAVRDSGARNPVPKVHVYSDHVFVVLHAPERGAGGHVHYVELDQFIGPGYLVTVHGPTNPAVAPESALVETHAVLKRIQSGRFRPESSHAMSFALVTALTGRMRDYVTEVTKQVWGLEQRVTAGHLGDPEQFLEEMFQARHGLLAVHTMARLGGEIYGRMSRLGAFGAADGPQLIDDNVDQFRRVATLADSQKEYLQGVIEFYQTRTNTKMTIAAERLAVIAAVTLPVTALSSILGMNVIVNAKTHYGELAVALAVMTVMSITLLIWAKRKGWW